MSKPEEHSGGEDNGEIAMEVEICRGRLKWPLEAESHGKLGFITSIF